MLTNEPGDVSVGRQPLSLVDTILIPPGTQYRATRGKAGKRNRLDIVGFAGPCKPLQHLRYHS